MNALSLGKNSSPEFWPHRGRKGETPQGRTAPMGVWFAGTSQTRVRERCAHPGRATARGAAMTKEQKPTLVWTEIDFDKDGKQVGVLHLPYSVTRSAYGMIDIPIAVIRHGEGPSVLLMAGNHGDEYEGQVTLARLIHDLEASDVRGRVIILPAANLPAAMAGARVSPLDSGNLNRAFPGEADGSPTWQIAHYIDSVLAPACSAWLDLHSGGSSMDYLPFAGFYESGDDALDARSEAIMRAFGAPRSVRVTARPDPRLAVATAHRRKIPYFGGE